MTPWHNPFPREPPQPDLWNLHSRSPYWTTCSFGTVCGVARAAHSDGGIWPVEPQIAVAGWK